jgi:hypothetical protein
VPPPPLRVERVAALLQIDFSPSHRPPSVLKVALATALSIGFSLLADALLVKVGTKLFPSTVGYSHFRFGDYATLTVIGIIIAAAGWPILARVTAAPRRIYFWLAIAVTAVLLLPDLYLLAKGQPARAVAVLMVMHLAIGLITYNLMVRVAPVRRQRRSTQRGAMAST